MQASTAHWGFPDPAQVQGDDDAKRRAFREVMLVVGVLIEVPVMLLVVCVVNQSKNWYEQTSSTISDTV